MMPLRVRRARRDPQVLVLWMTPSMAKMDDLLRALELLTAVWRRVGEQAQRSMRQMKGFQARADRPGLEIPGGWIDEVKW